MTAPEASTKRAAAVRAAIAVLALLALAGLARAIYLAADPEKLDLDDAARAAAPGRFVRLNDGMTHYELAGPAGGDLVVLAAGMSVPYYIWDPTAEALRDAGFRVLRYDYYGRGYSDRPEMDYTQDAYVRQLAELLDALQVHEPFHLAGLSFGGSVVTTFADRHPERVRSLVYIDPSFRTPYLIPLLHQIPPLWDAVTAIFNERWWPESQLGDFLHPERFPDWPDRYREQLQYRGFRRAQWSTLVANAGVDQGPELKRVGGHARRVLVFWGQQDPVVPIEFSAGLLEAMPRARLVKVDQAGHLPQWERPDVVQPELLAFLRADP